MLQPMSRPRSHRSILVLLLIMNSWWVAPVVQAQIFKVDAGQSTVTWNATKVVGGHNGTVAVKSGTIEWNQGVLGVADVVMDMNAIVCLDISNENANAKLVNHLRSEDFFHVDKFPEARFKTTSITVVPSIEGDDRYEVSGQLTIKGVAHPATFTCEVERSTKELKVSGDLTFDRTRYGIQYRSGSFFDGLGDRMINDEVKLTFELIAR